MTEALLRIACDRLRIDENTLARRLGVSVGCLRSWRHEAPPYAQLALSALIAGLDPEMISRLDNLGDGSGGVRNGSGGRQARL
jgi:hypothetical protein